jgi:hypothetical protein
VILIHRRVKHLLHNGPHRRLVVWEDEGCVRAIFRSVRDPFCMEASPLKEALARLGTQVAQT